MTLGTTVYVRASDENENAQRMVGVQRENFYGALAGSLYTGNEIADGVVAAEFGKISGFSASVGQVFADVSMLIEEPEAIVEGMIALFELIKQEGANTVEILVDSYVKQFQQKQAQNNPYGSVHDVEHPELYETSRENWYTGYAAGFLAKLVVGGSAQSALKSSKQVQRIGSRLSDTGALRALTRVSDAKHALKAKATARILLTIDGVVPERLLSQADTAGQAYRLWRLQHGIDAAWLPIGTLTHHLPVVCTTGL